jgi:predicted transposase YbfD/YdcC
MDASAANLVLRWASDVKDPRRHNRVHPLPEMIIMVVIAVLCSCDSWQDIAEFCEIRKKRFVELLPRVKAIPSHDTFARVFARLDPPQLEQLLRTWMTALNVATGGRLVAIDGKSLRRSFKQGWDKSGMAHIVSAFTTENGLVLAQLGVDDKDNELTGIKQLLAMVDLKASTVTIDALGCQREVAEQIVKAGGDYVLCVKKNQPALLAKVKPLLDEAILDQMEGWQGSQWQQTNGGHGRIETRRVWVTTEVTHLGVDLLAIWPELKAVVAIERVRQVIGKQATTQRHYYIVSNGTVSAERVGRIVRGHWGIENGLHYVLDVSFDEDHCRVRKGHGAENLSRIRRLAANLLKQNADKRSIKSRRKRCGWSEEYLFQTLFAGLPASAP